MQAARQQAANIGVQYRRARNALGPRFVSSKLLSPLAAFVFAFIGSFFFFFLMSLGQAQLAVDCTVTGGVCGAGCDCTTTSAPDGTYKNYPGVNLLMLAFLAFATRFFAHVFMAAWSTGTLDLYYEIAMAIKNGLVGDHKFYLGTFLSTILGLFLGPLASAGVEIAWHDSVSDLGVAQISQNGAGSNFYTAYLGIAFVVVIRVTMVMWTRVEYDEEWTKGASKTSHALHDPAGVLTHWPEVTMMHMLHALMLGVVEMLLVLVFGKTLGITGWPTHAFWVGVFNAFSSEPLTPDTALNNVEAYWILHTVMPLIAFAVPFMFWAIIRLIRAPDRTSVA